MQYLVVEPCWGVRRLIRVDNNSLHQAFRYYNGLGQNPRIVCSPPSMRTIRRWRQTGKPKAVDGCKLDEPHGRCEHNKMSWLTMAINLKGYTNVRRVATNKRI